VDCGSEVSVNKVFWKIKEQSCGEKIEYAWKCIRESLMLT